MIWVTGATGFLGGRVVESLLDSGHVVIASGRQPDALAALQSRGARTLAFDLSDETLPALPALDAVVHCAALSSPWGRPRDFHRANVTGTRSALVMARRAGARRFVHISTPSVYFRFNNQLNVRETQPLPRPVNAYAATKALGEQDVLAALDLDPVILRPRGLYGRGDTALLPRLMNTARKSPLPLMNAGQTVTDLTHVDDVVSAVHAALDVASTPTKRLFNISGGVPLNLKSVTEEAGRRAGVSVSWRPVPTWAALAVARSLEIVARLRPGQPEPKVTAYGIGLFAFSQTLDISAARDVLGWTPRIGIKEGLERTFEGGHAG